MKFNSSGDTHPAREVLWVFIKYFTPLLAILLLAAGFLYLNQKKFQRALLKQSEQQRVELQKNMIVNELSPVLSDLYYLENLVVKSSHLSKRSRSSRKKLLQQMLTFSEKKSAYNCIQIMDESGKVLMRVYYNQGRPREVEFEEARPPGQRTEFSESRGKMRGEVYISGFHPVSPGRPAAQLRGQMITFGIPIYSSSGKQLGVLTLEYAASRLLSHLKKESAISDSQWMLVSAEGDYVFNSEDTAVVQPPFASTFPDAWNHIRRKTQGQFYTHKGLFTFKSVYPDSESKDILLSDPGNIGLSLSGMVGTRNIWKLISFLPEERIRLISGKFVRLLVGVNVLLALLLGFVSYHAARSSVRRREAERELAYREAEFRDLFENAPNGIFTLDAAGRILRVNRRAEEILGHPAAGLQGKSVEDILDMAVESEAAGRLLHRLRNGEYLQNEPLKIQRRDGRPGWISLSVRAVETTDGKLIGQRVSVLDITEQKILEEQLFQSAKMEAIGRLAGGVAHDFNNLLTVMTGYLSLILNSLKPGQQIYEDLQEVISAVERAAELTRQLLAFSRRQIMQPEMVDINDRIRGLEKMLRRILGEDIQLHVELAEDIAKVYVDPAQIEQVVMNLVVNARDAMPEGGILTIETAERDLDENYARQHLGVEPGRYIMLSVSDTGVGMDEETKAHIYEPFFTTKKEGKGTGLGLAMAYGIIKQNGGSIWVYSEPGKGTTFKIYLPAATGEVAVRRPEQPEELELRGSETILLAEDENSVRELARRFLEEAGYDVHIARDAEEALQIFDRLAGKIDVLVTDVVMPGLSGKELYERLAERRPALPVVYISGYTDNAVVHRGVLDAGTVFLQKPFKPQDLLRKIRQALQKT